MLTCHPISLSGSGQVMLFAVMRLSEFEEVFESEELTDALPDGAARHQSVPDWTLHHAVHGAHEHLTRPPVDRQVSEGGVERPKHHPTRRQGGGGGRAGAERRGEERRERRRKRRRGEEEGNMVERERRGWRDGGGEEGRRKRRRSAAGLRKRRQLYRGMAVERERERERESVCSIPSGVFFGFKTNSKPTMTDRKLIHQTLLLTADL
ncbi:hypothetical protein F7725_001275 [Dissostichus mawsoni]|uniref:Uncharacterized protein n=1 Tax=Dissostichus mawsoni TaxID=36200 RepID=A0A7J5ZH94_DISMA|nr:hypothetical protein F7725_001275 [Dissostichus mawsoni]